MATAAAAAVEGNLTLALPAPTASGTTLLPLPPPSSARRFPAPCWTAEETFALIECYRDKWLSLRRGNLRATHWQDVADAVAARCRHLLGSAAPATSLKTSVQCRHKIEKLRKRYRVERQRWLRLHPTSPPRSSWAFFNVMDGMDLYGSAAPKNLPPQPPVAVAPPSSTSSSLKDSSSSSLAAAAAAAEADTNDEDDGSNNSMGNDGNRALAGGFKLPRANQAYNSRPTPPPNFSDGRRFPEKFKHPELGEKRRLEEKQQMGSGGGMVGEMAAAVRMVGEGIMKMEKVKMELSREFEKARIEMELKRMEMFLDLHRRIVDAFVAGIGGSKKRRRAAQDG